MTDTSPGPGWWLASDGQWYPPHLHPDVRARSESAVDTLEEAPDASLTLDVTDDDVTDDDVSHEDTTDDDAPADERPNGHGHNGASNGWVVGDDAPETDDDAGTVTGEHPTAPENAAVAATGFALPTQYVPEREPIDWARVAEERAARRQANESRRRRKFVGATLASIGTLAVLVAIARNDGDNDDRTSSTDNTELAQDDNTNTSTTAEGATSSSELPSSTTVAPVTTAAGSVSVFALLPGTCVSNADLSSGLVTTVTEVPCDQPHTHEVYHKVTYTPPDGAYDAARISQFASEQCSQSFASYVGIPYDRSKYYFLNFAPTEESWTQKGDREVVCLLFLQGSELTGSAKGTAQ